VGRRRLRVEEIVFVAADGAARVDSSLPFCRDIGQASARGTMTCTRFGSTGRRRLGHLDVAEPDARRP
jgi:hypothetical protein